MFTIVLVQFYYKEKNRQVVWLRHLTKASKTLQFYLSFFFLVFFKGYSIPLLKINYKKKNELW